MRLRVAGVTSRRIGNEVVLLDHQGGRYLTISGCGVLLFDQLRNDRGRDELVAAVLSTFDVDEKTARKDVDRFVGELSDAGLLSD